MYIENDHKKVTLFTRMRFVAGLGNDEKSYVCHAVSYSKNHPTSAHFANDFLITYMEPALAPNFCR